MWEAFWIIVILGGLETYLWYLQRKHEMKESEEDKIMQAKQLEVAEGILTELQLAASKDEEE